MVDVRIEPSEWAAALEETDGRQMVVAGPGTGKTEFLVRRVAHLVNSGVRPTDIAVLSFSRRSASRLRSRIDDALAERGASIDATTFHSLASRVIEATTPQEPPITLTTPEQVGLVRDLLIEERLADWPIPFQGVLDTRAFAAEVADFLLRCSERLLDPDDIAELAASRPDWRGIPALYARYRSALEFSRRFDYGTLLRTAVEILGDDPPPGAQPSHVIVDEYQDTTPAQAEMAELLAASGNLTVAGDPYQSIYSFRGAEVENVAEFSRRAATKRWILGKSFRVPAEIMDAALRVVSSGELPGSAGRVEAADHPGSAETYVFDQETAEAEWIAREVEHLVRVQNVAPREIAVVVRSKRELITELSRALERRDIPHDPPTSRLVDHPAVRAIHDIVLAATSGHRPDSVSGTQLAASDAAMRRTMLGPLFAIPIGQMQHLQLTRHRRGLGWGDVIAAELPTLSGLAALLTDSSWTRDLNAADGFWHWWSTIDTLDEIVAAPERTDWRKAWTAFAQMLTRQAERDSSISLAQFFEMVDNDDFEATPLLAHHDEPNRVALTTLHQVKGLSFEVVFIANAVEGVFPDLRRSRRMLHPELLSPTRRAAEDSLFAIQEEMRLAYTAMTRARRRVIMTATDAGVDQGERRPSRFLIAAAADAEPGPPDDRELDPLTIHDAEITLRRTLTNPEAGPVPRLTALALLANTTGGWWDPEFFAGARAQLPDKPVIVGELRLSPSQADSYQRCPRRYALERRVRLGDSSSVYTHFGELVHDVLELAEAEMIGTEARHNELDRTLEILDERWQQAEFGSPALNEAWHAKAVALLTKLYERWPGKGAPVELEMPVTAEIDGVPWTGRVDRVEATEDGYRVIDYKTGTSVPTKDEAAESIQLGFYAMCVAEELGPVTAAELWFPRHKSVSVTTRSADLARGEAVRSAMTEVTEGIEAENWAPRVNSGCDRCPFRRSCPAWPEGRGAFVA